MKPKEPNVQRTDLDDGEAFLPDPRRTGGHVGGSRDTLADMIAEEYVGSATSAEEQAEDTRDQVTADELGGPFVEVSANEEFAEHPDDEAPEELESDDKEPFPTAMRSTTR